MRQRKGWTADRPPQPLELHLGTRNHQDWVGGCHTGLLKTSKKKEWKSNVLLAPIILRLRLVPFCPLDSLHGRVPLRCFGSVIVEIWWFCLGLCVWVPPPKKKMKPNILLRQKKSVEWLEPQSCNTQRENNRLSVRLKKKNLTDMHVAEDVKT